MSLAGGLTRGLFGLTPAARRAASAPDPFADALLTFDASQLALSDGAALTSAPAGAAGTFTRTAPGVVYGASYHGRPAAVFDGSNSQLSVSASTLPVGSAARTLLVELFTDPLASDGSVPCGYGSPAASPSGGSPPNGAVIPLMYAASTAVSDYGDLISVPGGARRNAWHRWAYRTAGAGAWAVFLDGASAATGTLTTATRLDGDGNFYVGGLWLASYRYKGGLAACYVFDTALDDAWLADNWS